MDPATVGGARTGAVGQPGIGVNGIAVHGPPPDADACSVLPQETRCGPIGPQPAPAERSVEPRLGRVGKPVRVGPSILLPVFASLAMIIPARFSGVCPPTSRCAG